MSKYEILLCCDIVWISLLLICFFCLCIRQMVLETALLLAYVFTEHDEPKKISMNQSDVWAFIITASQ